MKVILTADVKKVGKKGEVIETSEGYGRNYLIRNGLGKEATAKAVNQAHQDQAVAEHRAAQRKDEAVMLASQLEKVVVKMQMKMGANGKMFGSIASKDVAEALLQQTKMEGIDRHKIEIKQPIKAAGRYTAVARLHPEVVCEFAVEVEAVKND